MHVYGLGQEAFLVRSPRVSFLIDASLSHRLAEKYGDHIFPHKRQVEPPITVAEIPAIDFVFCTHHHGDHLDIPTIIEVAHKFPGARFVVPAASELEIGRAGLRKEQIIWAEADRVIRLAETLTVTPMKAAHEGFEYDQFGRHRFLGYLIQVEAGLIYHSGDTVRYPGLMEQLAQLGPQLALLPVNGRRAELREQNIAGNLTLEEAVQLFVETGISALIAHHFLMVSFYTICSQLVDQ